MKVAKIAPIYKKPSGESNVFTSDVFTSDSEILSWDPSNLTPITDNNISLTSNSQNKQNMAAIPYPHSMAMIPKAFSNKENTQNAAEFVDKFDTYKEINGWNNIQAAKHFYLFLSDGPATWYRTIENNIKDDYEILKEVFLTNYDNNRNSFL